MAKFKANPSVNGGFVPQILTDSLGDVLWEGTEVNIAPLPGESHADHNQRNQDEAIRVAHEHWLKSQRRLFGVMFLDDTPSAPPPAGPPRLVKDAREFTIEDDSPRS